MTDHALTLTVEQAGKVLGISRSTAYELVRAGDIPSLRLGRRLVVPVARVADGLGVTAESVWKVLEPASTSHRETVAAAGQRVASTKTTADSPLNLF